MTSQDGTPLIEIGSEADFTKHTSKLPASTLTVVYFHAPWAAPCQQMSTVLQTLAATYPVQQPPRISFLSINAEEIPELSEKYDVTAVPFIVLEKESKVLETISGSDASKVRLAVERHVEQTRSSKITLPPAQNVVRQQQEAATLNGLSLNGTNGTNGTKDMSTYVPGGTDPKTAPEYSSGTVEQSKDDLFKRLEGLTKSAPVMLFMKGTPSAPQCGFSRQTVGLLRSKSIRYGFFNILADDEVRQGLKEYADWPTFPQLWVDGELIGGLDIVKEEFENNQDFLSEYSAKAQDSQE